MVSMSSQESNKERKFCGINNCSLIAGLTAIIIVRKCSADSMFYIFIMKHGSPEDLQASYKY